jgi:membrane-associated phospholipid phosphatase
MGFSLVLTAEHYVFDIVAGFGCAFAVHLVWNALDRRRSTAGRGSAECAPVPVATAEVADQSRVSTKRSS